MAETAIAIVCKTPRPGRSKTRLIPRLGPSQSAALARAFLVDIADCISALRDDWDVAGYAICSPEEAVAELGSFLPQHFGYAVHTDVVLGRVLAAAVDDLLGRGHANVILVNGDSPTLPPALLTQAVAALRLPGQRVVFGPAVDGGYYLVGLNHSQPRIFEDIPWSTPSVMTASLAKAKEIGLSVEQLGFWYDVDDPESFDWLISELNGRRPNGVVANMEAGPGSATRAMLANAGYGNLERTA